MYRSFPSLVIGQIEEEDSTWVTRESEDIKWGGNRGIPTCVGAAGYQRGWESIAMCVNLAETMLWRCGEGGGSWWKCGKWSRIGAWWLGIFYIYFKTCTNRNFAQKIFLMIGAWRLGIFYIYFKTCTNKKFDQKILLNIGAWRLGNFWGQENIFGGHIIEKSGIERLLF